MFDFAKIFLAMVCAGSAVILFNMGYEFMDTGYGLNPLVAFPGMTVLADASLICVQAASDYSDYLVEQLCNREEEEIH